VAVLAGATAVVTGGATGIGRAIAERLAADGARVVCGQLGAGEHAAPHGCELRELDVRDEAAVGRFVAAVGAVDVLVNNAALTGPPVLAPFLDHPAALFRDLLATNLYGPFLLTQAAARTMVRSGRGGRIVNVASVDAFVAEEYAAGYVATKTGLLGLTRAAAVELAPHGITVNAIAPGQIWSEAGVAAAELAGGSALAPHHARVAPLGEAGEPRDVAGVAAFLASPDARWITGATIVVDGGYLAA
jgi:NAD(P)-dependent dehydrogenase (short-subunit alcohol dehydrogenase family)